MEQARTAIATEEAGFILVPAVARDEIGQLTFYLEQGLRSLRDIAEHLRGSSGNRTTLRGTLYGARCSFANARTPSSEQALSWPAFATRHATTRSPHVSSGMPTTATSAMLG